MAKLQQRGKRWYIRWYEHGKEHKRSLGPTVTTEAQALRWLKEFERRRAPRAVVLPVGDTRITLREFKDSFLTAKQGLIAANSLKRYEVTLGVLANELGGNFLLRDLTTHRINEWVSRRLTTPRYYKDGRERPPVTRAGVNTDLRHLRHALHWACEEMEFLDHMPRIKLLRTPKPLPRRLSGKEMQALFQAEEHPDRRRFWQSSAYTGCRRAELVNLRWRDIRWKPRPMALVNGKGQKQRLVPLFAPALEALGEPGEPDQYVFLFWSCPRTQGKASLQRVHPDTLTHWFAEAAKKAGIKARLHDLRHTFATNLIEAGINPRFVQQILGHESLTTTEIYASGAVITLYDDLARTITGSNFGSKLNFAL